MARKPPDLFQTLDSPGVPIKAWIRGVPVEEEAKEQLRRVASLPIVWRWIAAMPDVHVGKGATVGSVIPTKRAIIPAAVGVDLGCGMMAVRTSLTARDLPESLHALRSEIEAAVPHGREGTWKKIPGAIERAWKPLAKPYEEISERHPSVGKGNDKNQLGTLGGGNHFVEICLDETDHVWAMLHSGSRGVGNRIGTYFIELAKEDMRAVWKNLPDKELSYFTEGTRHFEDYYRAVNWAQDFARLNRELMMDAVLEVLRGRFPPFEAHLEAVNCHHNYVTRERHFNEDVYVTRKGAVRAGPGEMGILPGSMGAKSFIVRGRGNPESFHSCAHGAGRKFSRTAARKNFTVEDHREATRGIECRKDAAVLDETPGAYKNIEDVLAAQADLVEVVHTLRQILVVKG